MSDAARETTPQPPVKAADKEPPSRGVAPKPLFGGLFVRLQAMLTGAHKDNDAKESIEDILDEDDATDSLSPKERAMLKNLLEFGDLKVSDIMVPRADIVGLEVSFTLDQVLAIFADAQHSRMPIYRETLDEPLGVIHLKDLIPAITNADLRAHFTLMGVMRDVQFVAPSMPAIDLLLKMQASRSHLALVIDEYGGTDGLISIEDLVEQIVGEIEDEYDTDEDLDLIRREDGGFDADARVTVEDLEEAAGLRLALDDEEPDFDTIGGLMAALAGHVPRTGEVVRHPAGLEFEVSEADPRRVKRVRIRRTREPDPVVSAEIGPG